MENDQSALTVPNSGRAPLQGDNFTTPLSVTCELAERKGKG